MLRHLTIITCFLSIVLYSTGSSATGWWSNLRPCSVGVDCWGASAPIPIEPGSGSASQNDDDNTLEGFRTGQIRLFPNRVDRTGGYVRVGFSFVGQRDVYDLVTPAVTDIFERNFGDWFSSFFRDERSLFVVTLEVKSDGQTLWNIPLLAIDQRESFNLVEYRNEIVLNNEMNFWVDAGTDIQATVQMRRTRDLDFQIDRILRAFAIAEDFATAVSRVVSPIPVRQLRNDERDDLAEFAEIFREFDEIKELTVASSLNATERDRVIDGEPVAEEVPAPRRFSAIQYHFQADTPNSFVTKLLVYLEHRDSLIAGTDRDDIPDAQIYSTSDQGTPTLSAFLFADTATRNALTRASGYQSEPLRACEEIRAKLAEVLSGNDVPIALNAFLWRQGSFFRADFDANCFEPGEDALIKDNGYPVFSRAARGTADPEPVELSPLVMSNLARSMGLLWRASRPDELDGQDDITGTWRDAVQYEDLTGNSDGTPQVRSFLFHDPQLVLGGVVREPYQWDGISLVAALLNTDGWQYGCMTRSMTNTLPAENKYSFLVAKDGQIIEVILDFANTAIPGEVPSLFGLTLYRRDIAEVRPYAGIGATNCENWAIWG